MLALAPGGASGHDLWLLGCAAAGIAGIVVLVTVAEIHPFIALIAGSAWVGLSAGAPAEDVVATFQRGVGETLGGVGVVVALGTMLGKLVAESGAADRIVSVVVARAGARGLPWAMALVAMLVGMPMFFEVGLVLLMPVIAVMSRRTGASILRVGIPALAALSVCHGLVPPHPGPLIAAAALHADVGHTILVGLIVAVPTVALAGPLFGAWCARRMDPRPPATLVDELSRREQDGEPPPFGVALATILLPVALMVARSGVEVAGARGRPPWSVVAALGHPVSAMALSVVVAMWTLARSRGTTPRALRDMLAGSLAPIAGMLMIIGAGGGFKQTLVDSGVGAAMAHAAQRSNAPGLVLGWLIAAVIRVATGSATVATVTASGIMAPLAAGLPPAGAPLLALSIGSGSLFFSHVNDAGFWLVKECFGMSVGETVRSWSTMETIISVVALACVLLLAAAGG
ncbi:MAG TPA: gluconate:H+ symporter [Polyangiaceae bacterium]|nr:gluconate:H+ symporter [Polyangiaceae bacterium]